jgi:serine/threonine-protein kinase
VSITLSKGGVLIPNVTGLSEGAAKAAFQAAGLSYFPPAYSPGSPAGNVLSQSPPANALVDPSTIMFITVATSGVTLPNVKGMTKAAATKALTDLGLVVNSHNLKDCSNPGKIVDEIPRGGTFVPSGSTVDITVDTSTTNDCH